MKYKTVICTKCGKRIGQANPKVTSPLLFNCRDCWKLNVYDPQTGKCKLGEIPQRATSSGYTFI